MKTPVGEVLKDAECFVNRPSFTSINMFDAMMAGRDDDDDDVFI